MLKRIGVALAAVALLVPLTVVAQKGGRSSSRFVAILIDPIALYITETEKHFN